jgi:hypothetical protein
MSGCGISPSSWSVEDLSFSGGLDVYTCDFEPANRRDAEDMRHLWA